jgi:ABC-type multidrug transport system fused ATPase/permease subunit
MAKVYLFLDAVLRSLLYSHFSESLSGLATIRAYGEVKRFCADNENRVDIENRAYWLAVTNQVCFNLNFESFLFTSSLQCWLLIRVDFLGALLTFAVAMLTIGTRFTISPGRTGLVLSYILTIQSR